MSKNFDKAGRLICDLNPLTKSPDRRPYVRLHSLYRRVTGSVQPDPSPAPQPMSRSAVISLMSDMTRYCLLSVSVPPAYREKRALMARDIKTKLHKAMHCTPELLTGFEVIHQPSFTLTHASHGPSTVIFDGGDTFFLLLDDCHTSDSSSDYDEGVLQYVQSAYAASKNACIMEEKALWQIIHPVMLPQTIELQFNKVVVISRHEEAVEAFKNLAKRRRILLTAYECVSITVPHA